MNYPKCLNELSVLKEGYSFYCWSCKKVIDLDQINEKEAERLEMNTHRE